MADVTKSIELLRSEIKASGTTAYGFTFSDTLVYSDEHLFIYDDENKLLHCIKWKTQVDTQNIWPFKIKSIGYDMLERLDMMIPKEAVKTDD